MKQADTSALVGAQLASWVGRKQNRTTLYQRFEALNAQHPDIVIFVFQPGQPVRLLDKPYFSYFVGHGSSDHLYQQRAKRYRSFFDEVQQHTANQLNLAFIMSMKDMWLHELDLPAFAFQKPQGSPLILLPDVDFVEHQFYEGFFLRPISYDEKRIEAVFVGSTTGATHTVESVAALSAERLRLACHFKGKDGITFSLPVVCQCRDDAAQQAIKDLNVGGGPLSWDDQNRFRFIMSVDGNGASCSRVALALHSGSVLMKFASPHSLYYFSAMRPWHDYLLIDRPEQVEQWLAVERSDPGFFAQIAANGNHFAKDVLSKSSILAYTAGLLFGYQQLVLS